MRRPFVVENRVTEFVATAAALEALPLWEKSIAGTVTTAVAERDFARGWVGQVVQVLIARSVANELLQPLDEFCIPAKKLVAFSDQDVDVDQILGEHVAEF